MYKKNVIWLASYPKSGNTWFRVFLTNLLSNSDIPANINDLAEASISSSRKIFDEYTGLSSSDLTFEEIDSLRPQVYRMQSAESDELLFKKVHDKYYKIANGEPLFPTEISKGVIYIIRNPLDVLVSFANHSSKPVETMIKTMNDTEFAFCNQKNKLQNQLRQILGSWSDHVNSWTKQKDIPVYYLRYEDMKNNPLDTFKKAAGFIEIDKTELEIKNAIEKSEFDILTDQEKRNGFKEKTIKSNAFFRKGKIGDWRNHLTEKEANLIIKQHKETMLKFGYIDKNEKSVF